jgi:hypothetical protein
MRRALLVLAMTVSLWPLAAIALSFASDTNTTANASQADDSPDLSADIANEYATSGSRSAPARATPPAPQPQVGRLKSLDHRLDRLLGDFKHSSSLSGTVDRVLSLRADDLARALADWRRDNAGRDSTASRFAAAEQRLSKRLAVFARAPTQERLNRFNAAIDSYNRLIP